jgi:arylsulfatase A-like enzyme
VLLLIAAGIVWREVHETNAAEERLAVDVQPPADAPNVIVIVLDTVRAKSLGLYGCERPTSPNLDRLASRGVAFDVAVSPAPWTLPSHASMFTGLSPEDLSTDWCIPLNDRRRTLAEELSDRGYVTAGFVANAYYCGKHTGLQRGFQHYDDARLLSADALRNAALGRMLCRNSVAMRLFGWRLQWPGRKDAGEINREFLTWLNDRPADRPYFAFLNYFDAHDPYLDAAISPLDPNCFVDHTRSDYTQQEFDALRESYERCVQSLDVQIGRLFDELERRGELQNTLVIVTSDHGEQFGEHGLVGHNNSLYRPATHVPLIVVHPGRVPAGVRVPNVVGLRDLAATVLDAVDGTEVGGTEAGGTEVGGRGAATIPGRSLARFWRGDSSSPALSPDEPPVSSHITKGVNAPAWFPNAESGLKSVWTDRWHYIRRLNDGAEELFDVERDADERNDLADEPPGRSALPELRQLLFPEPTQTTP